MKQTSKIILKGVKTVTVALLDIIATIPTALDYAFFNQSAFYGYVGKYEKLSYDNAPEYIHRLKRSGYIETKKVDNVVLIRLTVKGKIKQLENSADQTSDGRLRIISYDIPEMLKSKRQKFCRSIRAIGFVKLQKSLWVCSFIKADQIDLIIDDLDIRQYVAYFIIEKSNIDKEIKHILDKNSQNIAESGSKKHISMEVA